VRSTTGTRPCARGRDLACVAWAVAAQNAESRDQLDSKTPPPPTKRAVAAPGTPDRHNLLQFIHYDVVDSGRGSCDVAAASRACAHHHKAPAPKWLFRPSQGGLAGSRAEHPHQGVLRLVSVPRTFMCIAALMGCEVEGWAGLLGRARPALVLWLSQQPHPPGPFLSFRPCQAPTCDPVRPHSLE
jgi:hypothetical protein